MEGKSSAILIGGLIAVPVIGIAYYNYIVTHYDYSISNISVQSISPESANLLITIDVASTIGISFAITDIYFDIYMEGYKVGTVYQQTPLVVPNFGKGQVQALATVDLTILAGNLGSIIYNTLSGKQYNVSLIGYSHVKVGRLPFTTNVALKFGYSLDF